MGTNGTEYGGESGNEGKSKRSGRHHHEASENDVKSNAAPSDHSDGSIDSDHVIYHIKSNEIDLNKIRENFKALGIEDAIMKQVNKAMEPGGGVSLKKQMKHKEVNELVRKMKKIADLSFLIIVSLNDLTTLKMLKEGCKKPTRMKSKKGEYKYFFERQSWLKLIVNIVMKILGVLNNSQYDDVSCFESFIAVPEFYKSINQILMALLSIRNDPLIKSHDNSGFHVINGETDLNQLIDASEKEYQQIRGDLIDFFKDISSSVNSARQKRSRGGHAKRKGGISDLMNLKELRRLEDLYKQVDAKISVGGGAVEMMDVRDKSGHVEEGDLREKIKATLMNIPSLVLNTINFLIEIKTNHHSSKSKKRSGEVSKRLKIVIDKGISLLIKLLRKNNLGQGLFFNTKSSYLFWDMLDKCPILFLGILEETFLDDSSIIFKNTANSDHIFNRLTRIITHNLNLISPNSHVEISEEKKKIKMIEIYMVNTFLNQILEKNVDNSEERLFGTRLQEYFQGQMDHSILNYFNESSFEFLMEDYSPVLIGRRFRDIRKNIWYIIKGSKEEKKRQHKRNRDDSRFDENKKSESIEADMHYSFLKLFNEMTENWKHMKMSEKSVFALGKRSIF